MSDAHLLVVDDEPHVTIIIQHALQPSGFRVTGVRSLADARAVLFPEHDVNLLFLDVRLPDGSGMEFLEELRTAPTTSTMPVIILTGTGYEDVREHADLLGARYVSKPFSPSKLGRLVHDILGMETTDQ